MFDYKEKFYSCSALAQRYKVTRNTVYKWFKRGMLGGYYVGAKLRIPESAVAEFERGIGRQPLFNTTIITPKEGKENVERQ